MIYYCFTQHYSVFLAWSSRPKLLLAVSKACHVGSWSQTYLEVNVFFVCKVVSVSILVALFLGTKCGFTTKHMFSDHVLGNLDCCQVNRQMFLNHVQPFGEAHMNVNCLADCGSCNLVCKEFKIIITTTSTIYLYVFHEVNVLG